jgi:hypothetical protein
VIDPGRSIDWSRAGVTNGIPNRTTQCGATIAPYTGAATTINSAIANCGSGQFVQLGAGAFNLSSGISFGSKSNVTLRGMGADTTLLTFTGSSAGLYDSVVAIEGSPNDKDVEGNVCDWVGGYARGATTITLANCGSSTPARGGLTNLQVGSLLILDQLDEASDTGQIWNCAATIGQTSPCANTIQAGASRFDGPCNGAALNTNGPGCLRTQQQGVIVTAINGSTITISPGLYMPNWRTDQRPQAWYGMTTITGDGIENFSIDATNAGSNQTIMLANASNSWVKGVRSIYANRSHVRVLGGSHITIRDSYFYQNLTHASVSYGAELMGGWDSLIENNIFQQNTDSEPSCSSACAGNVFAYNFNIDNVWVSAGWMQAGFYHHAGGDSFNLWEGNVGPGFNSDQVHGTHHFETVFRNYLIGNQTAGCGSAGPSACTSQTIPIQLYSGSRYFNVLGNVLGQSGYHTNYTCSAVSTAPCNQGTSSIYALGYTNNSGGIMVSLTGFCSNPSCTSTSYYDPQTPAYLYRWGNYDVVTSAVRWCGNSGNTGWGTICNSTSEVPTGLTSYPQPVPTTQTLPVSLYLFAKPTWWGAGPYPAIGPDVAGGPGPGGHAYPIPAQACYANVMGGTVNGSGNVLTFKAASCYASGGDPPAAPTNLRIVVP